MSAALVLFEELLQCRLRTRSEASVVRKTRTLQGQVFELGWPKLQRLQLARMMLQEFEPRLELVRPPLQGESAIQDLKPHAMRNADLRGERFEAPEAIEELALRACAHERLKFVLAVNVDEDVADLAQQLDRRGLAIHIGARAAIAADDAANGKLPLATD